MKTKRIGNKGLLATLGCLISLTGPALAAEHLYTLTGGTGGESFGSSIVALGDLNGDGVSDFAAGDPGFNITGSTSFTGSGQVLVISGKNGATLFKLQGTPANDQAFGTSLLAVKADADAKLDIVVGAPGGAGAVFVYSGANGQLIRKITAPSPGVGSLFGQSLASAGDQNGDSKPDLFVGSPGDDTNIGSVQVVSIADGSQIREFVGEAAAGEFGFAVAALPDRNNDGKQELIVSSPGGSAGQGVIQLLASSDGAEIDGLTGVVAAARLGETLTVVADRDSDGKPDIIIGSGSGGTAFLVSSADLDTITDLTLVGGAAGLPVVGGGVLDIDRDGDTELLIGYPGASPVARVEVLPAPGGDIENVFEASDPDTGLGLAVAVIPGLGFAIGEPLAEGGGAVHVYSTLKDSDGDGVPDVLDKCKDSILTKTVKFGKVDSGVKNKVLPNGCSLADLFKHLKPEDGWKNHGQFVSKAGKLIKRLQEDEVVNKNQARKLQKAAAQSNIGKRKGDGDGDNHDH